MRLLMFAATIADERATLRLAVQRLVLAEFLEHDHGQKIGPGPAMRGDMERRQRLMDALAVAVSKFLSHHLDHFPAARDHFQCLGDVFPQLGQTRATAATAFRRVGLDDPRAGRLRVSAATWLVFVAAASAANSPSVADAKSSSI